VFAGDADRRFESWSAARDGSAEQSPPRYSWYAHSYEKEWHRKPVMGGVKGIAELAFEPE